MPVLRNIIGQACLKGYSKAWDGKYHFSLFNNPGYLDSFTATLFVRGFQFMYLFNVTPGESNCSTFRIVISLIFKVRVGEFLLGMDDHLLRFAYN